MSSTSISGIGALDQESPVIRVKNGDTVVLFITSDEAGTIHLHGYDLEDELGEEGVTRMEFVANLEGRFAMAMHPGSAGGHSHDNSDTSGCPDVVPLPEGAEPPTVQVNAGSRGTMLAKSKSGLSWRTSS